MATDRKPLPTRRGQLSLPIQPAPQPTATPVVQLRVLPGTTWQHIFTKDAA